ncbi:MAG: helix-turn-helix domain-containing protein [Flavobacteriaceae bacterium]
MNYSGTKIDKTFIHRLKIILEENLENEDFGVSELAAAANVSRSNLHRKVHAYNGNSTSQFIREYRLQKAFEMLSANGATVAEVAYGVGFSSPTYFNTCFKEQYGYPPGETRNIKMTSGVNRPDQHRFPALDVIWKNRWIAGTSLALVVIMVFTTTYFTGTSDQTDITNLEYVVNNKSIAVLPLKNLSGDLQLEYIGDGMTDAVITRLTQIGDLPHVIPFTSVLKYKNTDKSMPVIAQELGVQNILQGNFQLSGDQIKISLQLIDGPANNHFWSEEYNGKWTTNEAFAIQAHVAENVAKRMNAEIIDNEHEEIYRIPTQNREAYKYFLKANHQGYKYNKEGMENAIPLYEKAISLDSTYYDAYIQFAYLYLFGGASWGLFNEQEAWYKAKELLLKAAEIDSTDRKMKFALVDGLYLYEWDFQTMEKNYKTTSTLPINYNLQTGRFNESLVLLNQEFGENPTLYSFVFKAQTLFFLDRLDEATDLLEFSEEFYSDQIMYLRIASTFYYYMGEYEHSRRLLDKIITSFPDRPPLVLWLSALHAYRDGDMEGVNSFLSQLEERYKTGMSGSPAWFTALYYSSIGERENAFLWLQKSYDKHEVEMIWLREEPALRPLRSDRRYQELYKKVGFPMPQHNNEN